MTGRTARRRPAETSRPSSSESWCGAASLYTPKCTKPHSHWRASTRRRPPFLLVHGEQDTIIPVDEARIFRAALRAVSRKPVEYCEIPRAGHAFDLVDTSHARRCAVEVARFFTDTRSRHVAECAVAAG